MANEKYILGINGGVRPGYQDVSAVLLRGGSIVAAVEEERLNRIKHAPGQLPILAVKEVLRIAGIHITDVSTLAFHGSTWQPAIEDILKNHFTSYFGHCPPIRRFHHHDCHAASAYYASGFDEALILTVDGSGDGISTQVAVGRHGTLQVLERYARPQSLGLFYSMITQICGFTRDMDEYKLMGLAAFGKPTPERLEALLQITDSGYRLNEAYLVPILPGQPGPSRYEMLYTEKLLQLTGTKRRTDTHITDEYKNLAASAQFLLEQALCAIVKKYVRETGIRKICMAGGVALNCLANMKIEQLHEVDELFIQPAASDAGISLGAAYLAAAEQGITQFEKQTHVFYGSEYSDDEIARVLQSCACKAQREPDITDAAARALAQKKVIGWFQGRMEFGPRALGNRSILADPATPDIQSIVNQKIKFRESFRPFGASVLQDDFHRYFIARCTEAPYMTKVFHVKEPYRALLRGVTHADGTCRVQTVTDSQNPLYARLLRAFKSLTGHSVLLNTSYNLSHEPIVCTPRHAIASFCASGLDELFLGTYRLTK
ncbi:MAG: hypothetical protein NZM35_00600 [Chitinophagales bacterium]|nr:hypothetical protein [Chitinophagales bacterium]MDW8417817.1 carbamoyltransferase C-terminal domain-containing protein [Chitinophagales bacterium]